MQILDTDALYINADAKLLCATLEEGQTIQHRIEDGRHAYLVPVKGGITINGESRFYPLYVMQYHQVINDTLQDTAIAASY